MYIEELYSICERIAFATIDRINDINAQRGISNPTLTGECNRAAIIFFLHFHHAFYERNLISCLYDVKWYSDQVIMFKDTTRKITKDPLDVFGISCELVHGELAHNSDKIPEEYWPTQHTIVEIEHQDKKIYVDITSRQFHEINKEIPDCYVGYRMPWWFYPDRDNPKFNKK